jgi:aerobic-type carbon monoxide dehydrogenase small subunit (CoxS/CutS family)
MPNYTLMVNGRAQRVEADEDTPLLYVLQNELALKGPRFGCGMAQCGSCSILVNGREMRSCVTPVSAVGTQPITTLEGLAGAYARAKGKPAATLHPVQQAFIDEQAIQCGYCYNGMAVKSAELLARNPSPSVAQIKEAMQGHLCRCGTYPRVIKAVQRAAIMMKKAEA